MSGAFGWARNNNGVGGRGNQAPTPGTGYNDARARHQGLGGGAKQQPAADLRSGKQRDLNDFARKNPIAQAVQTPDGKGRVVCSASNVLVVVIDGTGSMGAWPKEIFKRLPLLYQSASEYLGTEDLEVLFIAHGDVRSDVRPIQVGKIGRGPELDLVLASFDMGAFSGGGQGTESHELVAYFLVDRVDLSKAQNVYTFFLTDEAACDVVREEDIKQHLGGAPKRGSVDTRMVLEVLRRKTHCYAVLCETNSYDPAPIKKWWTDRLDAEHVLPLSDARRVVDVMLGTMAVMVGKKDRFVDDLKTRLLPTAHGQQNVHTVLTAIDMVGKGTPSDPFHDITGTKGGTKSLM